MSVPPSVDSPRDDGVREVVQPVFPAGRGEFIGFWFDFWFWIWFWIWLRLGGFARRERVRGAGGGEFVGAVHDAVQSPRGVPLGRASESQSQRGTRIDSYGERDGVARGHGGDFPADAHGTVPVPRPIPSVPRVLERETSGDANAVLSRNPRGGGGRRPGASPRVQYQRCAVGDSVLFARY